MIKLEGFGPLSFVLKWRELLTIFGSVKYLVLYLTLNKNNRYETNKKFS